jgi:lysine 2,3-aminomutase
LNDRRTRRKAATRSGLIAAATRLFSERGIYQVSIDDITASADLGKGTFYKHFSSRDDLLAAVVGLGVDLLLEELRTACSRHDDILPRLLECHARFFEKHPPYLLIFHQVRGWLTLFRTEDNLVRAELVRYTDEMVKILMQSAGSAFPPDTSPARVARFLAGTISGVLSYENTLGEGLTVTPEMSALYMALIGPLRASPSAKAEASRQAEQDVMPIPTPTAALDPDVLPTDRREWSPRRFMAEASAWLDILRGGNDIESIRSILLDRVNKNHFMTYAASAGIHELDRVIVRDCARAMRGILHPRSERLSGFSMLEALVDVARGSARPDLTQAFWAEICHLAAGIEGRAILHGGDYLEIMDRLRGREAAVLRSAELDRLGGMMAEWMGRYGSGLRDDAVLRRAARREAILSALGAGEAQWDDWRWQLRSIARSGDELSRMACLAGDEASRLALVGGSGLPFGVTPYYASLFDDAPGGWRDRALRMQVIPPLSYIDAHRAGRDAAGFEDFMRETDTSPVDLITRRYAAIAILKPYNSCPQICVYCQRNWEILGPLAKGSLAPKKKIDEAIAWLGDHPAIHEVLVTGGDPLVLSDAWLKKILDALAAIPTIERIRLGTRTPVTVPMRFTPRLVRLLQSYRLPGRREICVVTHVQHPGELTPDLVKAVNRLRSGGIAVYNQLVYTFFISRRFEAAWLRRLLRLCGVDPYYTFYPKGKEETADYRVPIARLLQEQKEEARLLPGMARTDETVFNVPGFGKNYLNAWQHRDLLSVRPSGTRVYEFHPWEKKIAPQGTYVGDDIPILEYLRRLEALGEKPEDYESIWYYF